MKKNLLCYLLLAFLMAWIMWTALAVMGVGLSSGIATAILAVSMWTPGLAVLLTKRINHRRRILLASLRPRFRGNIRWYLCACFLPGVFTVLGGALYFFIYPGRFDPGLGQIGATVELLQPDAAVTQGALWAVLLVQIAVSLVPASLFNALFALGEEIGWRGFLFPVLRKMTTATKAHLISGLIWGLWHAPIIALGHNYGVDYPGYPWTGMLAMCLFCMACGVGLSFLTGKTGSIWPAALGHGAVNAAAALPTVFLRAGLPPYGLAGPSLVGAVSCIPLLFCAALLLVWEGKRTRRGSR